MTTRKLTDIDFMMMDVHRQLTRDEIDEIHPQASVDRSVEHVHEEAVDPPARCDFCFGPVPCAQHPNVEVGDFATSNDISVRRILTAAYNRDLETVVVVGVGKDGKEYLSCSAADIAESVYHLNRGIFRLNLVVEDMKTGDEFE
jgi:hypothetical protein